MSSQRTSDRRQPAERRLVSERRKQSEGRYAIFEVCRSTLHLALIRATTAAKMAATAW